MAEYQNKQILQNMNILYAVFLTDKVFTMERLIWGVVEGATHQIYERYDFASISNYLMPLVTKWEWI